MTSSPAAASGRPTLDTYGELQRAYEHFNARLFDGALPPCMITLQRKKRAKGYCSRDRFGDADGNVTDEIALNPGYFSIRTISATLSTLVHEMVHSWQFHFGQPSRSGYHNQEWADRMESVGLMPSHTGTEGGRRVGQKVTHYIMPGGPFAIACEDLLTQSFKLSWFDRFPPERPQSRMRAERYPEKAVAAPSRVMSPSVASSPLTAGLDGPDPAGRIDPFEEELPVERSWLPVGVDDEIDTFLASAGLIELPDDTINRSLRVRFRCPSCGSLAWGKPSLKILCGQPSCDGAAFVVS